MMEPKQYSEWLHEEVFLPVVVVIGTETAKARIKETNGLTLAELFAPFGGFYKRIPVTYQCSERHMRLDAFRVRFADADTAVQWTPAFADQVGASMVESSAPGGALDPQTALIPPSPWYEQWRLSMFRSLRWSEHEGLDQPAAAMLVVSSKEPEPILLFEQLLHSSNLPPLCTQGVLDPVPARAAVLLHDAADPESPSVQELEAKLEVVRARFAPHLALAVQVNRAAEPVPEVLDIFRPYFVPRGPAPSAAKNSEADQATKPSCRLLSRHDIDTLSHAAAEVVQRSAVPWMETQAMQLEAQISQNRKGFRNQIKYLWRKPREAGAGSTAPAGTKDPASGADQDSGASYPLSSVEGQIRLAGDLSFHLRDYETALGHYRSVVNDFKQDRSWKHAAGAYEMIGVCAYVSGAARSEWDRGMEGAYEHYLKAGASRHAMRVVALHQAMACDLKDSAARLMKVNGDMPDTGLRSALILEQAAQLYSSAGSCRKGAFHMVLAGHTFNKLGFKRLALGCYQSVVGHYTTKQWFHITDHFHFTMARQAFGLGLLQESLDHFLVLLNSFSGGDKRVIIQADRESTYLKEFLFVVKNWLEKCQPPPAQQSVDLRIPVISQAITVILPRDAAATSAQASPAGGGTASDERGTAEAAVLWETLGERALSNLSQEDRLELRWRDGRGDKVFDTLRRVARAGEEILVELELSNPMRLRLELTNAVLRGLLEISAGEDQSSSNSDVDVSVEFPAQDIVLGPLETQRVRLAAVPRREGLLKITGLSWSLFGQVSCERTLRVRGRRLRATAEQRASKAGVYGEDHRLELRVRAGLPQIRARLEGWPGTEPLLLGQLHKCALVVTCDTAGAQAPSLRISTSHPACLALAATPEEEQASGLQQGDTGGLICSCAACPAGAAELRIPLALRADAASQRQVRVCVLAESSSGEGPKSDRRQWVLLQADLAARPSLAVAARQTPSFREAGRLLFSCTVENRASEALEIRRVHCVAAGSPARPLKVCSGEGQLREHLGTGQLAHFFLTVPSADAEAAGAATMDEGPEEVSAQARRRLLDAGRATHAAPMAPMAQASREERHVDMAIEWATVEGPGRTGEAFAFSVPRERGGAPPCPLEMRLLAPALAAPSTTALVDVTLCVENISAVGDVSFYIVADPSPGFLWLGCERSEVIRLRPQAAHEAKLQACFPAPGVFNLNRLRFFVVGMPPGSGAVPASEQAPLAFSFPFERLIHITDSTE